MPEGITVESGAIAVRSAGAKDAAEGLFALAHALVNDCERFEAFVDGGREVDGGAKDGDQMTDAMVSVTERPSDDAAAETTSVVTPLRSGATGWPGLIVDTGPAAVRRLLEFFAGPTGNARTVAAAATTARQLLGWCETRGLPVEPISSLHVTAYIRIHPGPRPTVKQHLGAIRMACDWLLLAQVLPVSPTAADRGPKHVVTKRATPALSPTEARKRLECIDTGTRARFTPRFRPGIATVFRAMPFDRTSRIPRRPAASTRVREASWHSADPVAHSLRTCRANRRRGSLVSSCGDSRGVGARNIHVRRSPFASAQTSDPAYPADFGDGGENDSLTNAPPREPPARGPCPSREFAASARISSRQWADRRAASLLQAPLSCLGLLVGELPTRTRSSRG